MIATRKKRRFVNAARLNWANSVMVRRLPCQRHRSIATVDLVQILRCQSLQVWLSRGGNCRLTVRNTVIARTFWAVNARQLAVKGHALVGYTLKRVQRCACCAHFVNH
jgi:hypothetical protein